MLGKEPSKRGDHHKEWKPEDGEDLYINDLKG
jgi:hypothetical protein